MNKEIIKKYNIKAKKSLGQNYLLNDEILEKISLSIPISGENILEIGPGFGALTSRILAKNPQSFTLVELDSNMINVLNKRIESKDLDISKTKKFEILNLDILKFEPKINNYSIIANIPYYITSPILFKFLYEVEILPQKMVIMMQKDVAEKILDLKKSSYLSLYIAKKCKVKKICDVGKNDFFPSPKVDSCVLCFEIHKNFDKIDDKKFIKIIKNGFANPRKKLINNFEKAGFSKQKVLEIFEKFDVDANIRGEDLNVKMWIKFAESF